MKILSTSQPVKFLALLCGGGMLFLFLLFPLSSNAAFTKQINYQGKLTNSAGTAVSNGNYSIQFKLYTVATGGTAIWTEDQTVTVTAGLFSVMLGSVTSLDDINFNQPLYFSLNVNSDGEMTPRKLIGSVPSAFESLRLDGAASSTIIDVSQYLTVTGTTTLATTTVNNLTASQYLTVTGTTTLATSTATNFSVGTTSTASMLNIQALAGVSALNIASSTGASILTVASNGYVGIGTTTPNNLLSVYDLIDFNNTDFNTKLGYQAGKNVPVGVDANKNTFFGYQAGLSNVASSGATRKNTAIGYQSFYSNVGGAGDTALGHQSLYSCDQCDNVTAIGDSALMDITSGSDNTAVGASALLHTTTGGNNTAVGEAALFTNILGTNNVALGYWAGAYETGSNAFYIDNQDRTTKALGKTNSLMYGTFNANPNYQTLKVNAALTVSNNLAVPGTATSSYFMGNVGIGTTTPIYKFEVIGSGRFSSSLTLSDTVNCSSGFALGTDTSGQISCYSVGVPSELGTAGGWTTTNVLVTLATTSNQVIIGGSTNPIAKLEVRSGNIATTTLALVASGGQTAHVLDIYDQTGNLNTVFTADGKLGIGLTNPSTVLSVLGVASSTGLQVNGNGFITGNVGIGTTTPSNALEVNGNSFISGILTALTGLFTNLTTTNATATNATTSNLAVTGLASAYLSVNGSGQVIATSSPVLSVTASGLLSSSGGLNPALTMPLTAGYTIVGNNSNIASATSSLFISSAGLVGIGSTTPSAKLSIHDLSGLAGTNPLFVIASSTASGTGTTTLLTVLGNGNVGIGTAAPNQQLEIAQNFRMPSTTGTTPYGIIYKGTSPFISDFNYGNNGTVTTDGFNTFVGIGAGNLTMGSTASTTYTSSYNTAMGYEALNKNTTGYYNNAVGYQALYKNTSGAYNTAFGFRALYSNTGGQYNTADGRLALTSNIAGDFNTAEGDASLASITSGSNNTALGYSAGRYLTDGVTSLATANQSLYLGTMTMGLDNSDVNSIVIGYSALGKGSNTVVLGNDNIVSTFLKGNITTAGTITSTTTYSTTVGGTNRSLYVDNAGLFGYVSSSRRYKTNIVDATDTSWIYGLRPVHFDYLDPTKGLNQIGLIAEEVEQVNPMVVSYSNDEFHLPETVNYSSPYMITSILAEVQKLHTRLEGLATNLSIAADGILTVKTIKADELCLGATCVTEGELKMLLDSAHLAPSLAPVVMPIETLDSTSSPSTSSTPSTTSEVLPLVEPATTTEPVIEPVATEPIVPPTEPIIPSTEPIVTEPVVEPAP